MLKSELMNDKIRPKKLIVTKKNCKNVKKIIFLPRMFVFFRLVIERKNINTEIQNPKIKE